MPRKKALEEKNFYSNTGSKSNNFETDTKTEDLALINTVFLQQEKEVEVTDEEIKDAVVYSNGVTSIDFMMPEEERAILEKNLNMYSDVDKMNKLLNLAKKNKSISEDLKTMEIISQLGNLTNGITETLASEDNLEILNRYLKRLVENDGDVADAFKKIALANKAMLDARESMLAKVRAGKSGKKAKIALKFTNDSGEEYMLGASIDE